MINPDFINLESIIASFIFLPLLAGTIILLLYRFIFKYIFYIVFLLSTILLLFVASWWSLGIEFQNSLLLADHLSRTILLWSSIFSWVIILYAKGYFDDQLQAAKFYGYAFVTLGTVYFTILSDHAILLAIGWGLIGVWLYFMILMSGTKNAADAAKKTLIMVGGSDILMILGLVVFYNLTQSWNFSNASLSLYTFTPVLSFSLIFVGAFAKAGVFPFHSWLPDACQHSFVPVTSFLPLSLDKLLGIYFMIRLVNSVFVLNASAVFIIMSLGCICIIAGVMMALVQHDLRKLLGYHAISQVGYMVLGLGTGTAIGLLGAAYHMINHTVYKTLLFISGGMVEKYCNTVDLDRLGRLMKVLPITFTAMMIGSLAISGVFPLNGYFSKHAILYGIQYTGADYNILFWPLFWILASIGGLLTLSSFVKVIYALFIEQSCQAWERIKEKNYWMLSAMIILSITCIGLSFYGWAYRAFLSDIIQKEIKWYFSVSEGLIYIVFYFIIAFILLTLIKRHTRSCQVIGINLYEKVRNAKGLKVAYDAAEKKYADIYDIGKRTAEGLSFAVRSFHTGILSTYVFWFIIGTFIFALYYFNIF